MFPVSKDSSELQQRLAKNGSERENWPRKLAYKKLYLVPSFLRHIFISFLVQTSQCKAL